MFRIALRPAIWLSMNSLLVCAFAFGNSRQRLLELGLVRLGLAALHAHEGEEVARVLVVLVPLGRRDRDVAERRSAGRRVEDALDPVRLLVAVRERQPDR